MTTKVFISLILSWLISNGAIAQVLKTDKIAKLLGDKYFMTNEVDGLTFETKHNVSIAEYDLFMSDIRDSIAIETLYFSLEDDKECLRYLSFKKSLTDIITANVNLYAQNITSIERSKNFIQKNFIFPFFIFFIYPVYLFLLITHKCVLTIERCTMKQT